MKSRYYISMCLNINLVFFLVIVFSITHEHMKMLVSAEINVYEQQAKDMPKYNDKSLGEKNNQYFLSKTKTGMFHPKNINSSMTSNSMKLPQLVFPYRFQTFHRNCSHNIQRFKNNTNYLLSLQPNSSAVPFDWNTTKLQNTTRYKRESNAGPLDLDLSQRHLDRPRNFTKRPYLVENLEEEPPMVSVNTTGPHNLSSFASLDNKMEEQIFSEYTSSESDESSSDANGSSSPSYDNTKSDLFDDPDGHYSSVLKSKKPIPHTNHSVNGSMRVHSASPKTHNITSQRTKRDVNWKWTDRDRKDIFNTRRSKLPLKTTNFEDTRRKFYKKYVSQGKRSDDHKYRGGGGGDDDDDTDYQDDFKLPPQSPNLIRDSRYRKWKSITPLNITSSRKKQDTERNDKFENLRTSVKPNYSDANEKEPEENRQKVEIIKLGKFQKTSPEVKPFDKSRFLNIFKTKPKPSPTIIKLYDPEKRTELKEPNKDSEKALKDIKMNMISVATKRPNFIEKKKTVFFRPEKLKNFQPKPDQFNVELSYEQEEPDEQRLSKLKCKAESGALASFPRQKAVESKGHTFSQSLADDRKSIICKTQTSEVIKPNVDVQIRNSVGGSAVLTTNEEITQFLDGNYQPSRDTLEIGTSAHSKLDSNSEKNQSVSIVATHDKYADSDSQSKTKFLYDNNNIRDSERGKPIPQAIDSNISVQGTTILNTTSSRNKPVVISNLEKETSMTVRDPKQHLASKDILHNNPDLHSYSDFKKEVDFEIAFKNLPPEVNDDITPYITSKMIRSTPRKNV